MIIANPTATPVVYSKDGHVVGTAERREVSSLDAVGKDALRRGDLIEIADAEPEKASDDEQDAEVKTAPARRPGK